MYSEDTLQCPLWGSKSIIILVIASLLLAGCSMKPTAFGDVQQIVVFADDSDWYKTADSVCEAFEQIIETPQYEKAFTVLHPPLDSFNSYKRKRMMLLIGTLESKGVIGDLLNRSLTDANRNAIRNEEKYAFQQRDVWATEQYMMILAAPTTDELVKRIQENKDTIFRIMNNEANELMGKQLYDRGEQLKFSDELMKQFNFMVRVQHDYFMHPRPENKIVVFRRYNPDRVLTVHWVDTTEVYEIPDSWILKKREVIGNIAMDNRQINPNSITIKKTNFNDYVAKEIRGLWQQNERHIGGPFILYSFFDENTNRIYIIDLTVFAPEKIGEKAPLLRQLDIMAKTFKTSVKTDAH